MKKLTKSINYNSLQRILGISRTNFTFYKSLNLSLFFVFFVTNTIFSQNSFIKNEGQWEDEIKYKSEFNGGNIYLERASLNYNFIDLKDFDKYIANHHKQHFYEKDEEVIIHGHCVKMTFEGSNNKPQIISQKQIKEYFNYYIGNDKSKWASKVHGFNSITYKNLYDGIDLEIKVLETSYKYDFIVKPDANSNNIKINYKGADKIFIENGKLNIQTSVNDIIEQKPYAYQLIEGKKKEIACKFILTNGIVSYEFENGYNKSKELIIDPYIVFSRISSSSSNNFGYTATYDSKENAYGAGSVFSSGFITIPGSFDLSYNGFGANNTDVGIIKYSPDGLQRIYSTYLGGTHTELPHSIVVNSRDELYVFGTTSSNNFPMPNNITPYDATFNGGSFLDFTNGIGVNYQNGSDIFITKFNEDGTSLMASTYLGGSANDGLNTSSFLIFNYADQIRGEILLDKNDNCYIVSCTSSDDFPFENGFQQNNAGGLDAIIVKMDENLTDILWSSYLGGTSDEGAYSIAFDSDENLVIAGGTHSDDFPILNEYQSTFGGANCDGYITRIHSSGSGLLSSTYFGSSNYDQIYFVEVNNDDNVHIFGQTKAPQDEFIENAVYNTPNGGHLITKFNRTVDSIIWSTRFGDGGVKPDISPTAFLVDLCDRIFLSGWGSIANNTSTSGTNGLDVTSDAIDNTTDNHDFYFMVLKEDASSLVYASYFGGSQSSEHVDGGTSRFDKKGVVYQAVCAGCGGNQDFPTIPSGNNWPNNNSCNLGVVKYAFSPPSIIADFNYNNDDCAPVTIHFENNSQTAFNDTSNVEFIWNVDGQTFSSYHLDYTFPFSGVYEVTLIALEPQSCNFEDTITKQVTIIGNGKSNLPEKGVCNGSSVQIGIIPLSNPNVTYQWSPNYFISNTSIANPFVNPPIDATYTLIISNGNCTDTLIQKVLLGSIEIDIEPFDSVCLETEITLHATEIEGALYQWSPAELVLDGQSSASATFYVEESNQPIHLLVTNLDGCTDVVDVNLFTIDDLPELEVFADPDTIEASQSSQLLAESFDALSYEWEENQHFTNLTIKNPLAKNILETTTYNIKVHNGVCPKRDSVTVYVVIPDCLEGKFYVPNAFSPNGDGNNDEFKIRTTLINIENFYFAVYDRWGNKIFETTDKTKGWNGMYQGNELSPNVYGWYTEGVCPNGEDFFLKGNVTLLR